MDDDEKKELERGSARSQVLKALKKRKATPGLIALQLKQLMDWLETKDTR